MKIAPFITSETSFDQHVSELVFGVNIFDLDLAFPVVSIQQPSLRDSVGSGNVSHHWTSSFDDHLDHCLVVFKIEYGTLTTRFHV